MARTYEQDLEEISAVFPGLGPKERDARLWRAILDICNENDLLFMIGEARIVTEPVYNTGTVAVTEDGTGITLTDGVWDTTWESRKIIIEGRSEIYTVSAFGSSTTATLTEGFLGETGDGLTYQMFRDTYPLPADCELTKDLMLFDIVLKQRLDFVDYAEFRDEKLRLGTITGTPCAVVRRGINADGLAEIEFGPRVPSEQRVYRLDYFRSPQPPATRGSAMSPAWPTAFEDVRHLRALQEIAFAKGHARRFEFEKKYDRRIWEMMRKFDGGNEMKRRIRGTRAASTNGMTIIARWTGN